MLSEISSITWLEKEYVIRDFKNKLIRDFKYKLIREIKCY